MLRIMLVALTVAAALNAASGYFIVESLTESIESARRYSLAQMRRVETDFNAADQTIISQVADVSSSTDSNARAFGIFQSQYVTDREAANLDAASVADRVQDLEVKSIEIFTYLDKNVQRLDASEISVESLREVMAEFNTELAELAAQIEELRSIQTAPYENVFEGALSREQPCEVTPLNKQEQLRPLERRLSRSNHSGTHDVMVRYDVTTDGSTVLKGLQSDTASSNLMEAVSTYVNGLKFNEQETVLTNCKMVVKLDNSSPWF